MRRVVPLAGLLLLLAAPVLAQTGPPAPAGPAAASRAAPPRLPEARQTNASAAPATEVRIPSQSPAAIRYHRTWYALYFVGTAWQLAGLALALLLRVGPRLRDFAERRTRNSLLRAAIFWVSFSLLLLLWSLPLSYTGYAFDHSNGFATQSVGTWLRDRAVGWLFELPNLLAVWLGYLLLERSPRRWWLWLWGLSIPWLLLQIVLWPVLVAPAYNRFVPLPPGPLRARLEQLADHAGVHGARIYEVDISRRTTRLNAYVAGLGPTKRMVIWDTTLKALDQDEIIAIMGHEMGHYVLGHVWQDFVAGVLGAFVLLGLLAWLLPRAVRRGGGRLDIRSPHDLGGLPLLLLILDVLLFLQTPAASALSRRHEHEADRYGLELTRLNVPMARAFVAFVSHDFADPDPPPFIVFWLSTHPPLRERIDFALHFRPWPLNPQ